MEGLVGYASDEDSSNEHVELLSKPQAPSSSANPVFPVNAAASSSRSYFVPQIPVTSSTSVSSLVVVGDTIEKGSAVDPHMTNRRIHEMYAPLEGPAHPYKKAGIDDVTGMGTVQSTAIDDYTFKTEFQANESKRGGKSKLRTDDDERQVKKKAKRMDPKDRLKALDDVGDEYSDPWAKPANADEEEEKRKASLEAIAARKRAVEDMKEQEGEQEASRDVEQRMLRDQGIHFKDDENANAEWLEKKLSGGTAPPPLESGSHGAHLVNATSKFHGQERVDYQGRAWTHPPPGMKARDLTDSLESQASIAKKCVKKYVGHTQGVQCVEFLPGTGHLLLSAGLEGKCKVWDVCSDRNVKMTYHGHSRAVRSVSFSESGMKFLSSGFDRIVRLWDTETGQAVSTFSNKKMGYCVRFTPGTGDDGEFVVAASDNRLYQWDARSGEVVQEYNYHLKPVNSVTFYDGGKRFFSTSDDKKILCWEYGVPVPTKYIAEPDMYSIPACTLHPDQEHFAGQSMDNRIVTYSCQGDKVRALKKKTFVGHKTAGYACGISFSPNGQYVVSGDGVGLLHVWDWKNTKALRKFQAHDNGPCMDSAWHPLLPSTLATCGWDGVVKLWQ